MVIDLGGGRELAVTTAAETLSPSVTAQLQIYRRNWFVALPFPAGDERNLHFFNHLIGTFSLSQLCLLSIEKEADLCNLLLWNLNQIYPAVAFYLITLPNDAAVGSDEPRNPLADSATFILPPQGPDLESPSPLLPLDQAQIPDILIDIQPVAEPEEETLFCVVCHEDLTQGMVTLCCCQVLCPGCYLRVQTICPMCRRSPFSVIDAVFDSNIAYKNDNIEEKCACGKGVKRRDKPHHDAKECPNRQLLCSGCGHSYPFPAFSTHLRDIHKEEILLALARLIVTK